MSQKTKETPIALLSFFTQLDPGGAPEGECQLHYGCSCVLHKGLEAARMLVDIQEMLGIKPGAAPAEAKPAAPTAAPPAPVAAAVPDEMFEEAQAEIDRLLGQNMELAGENKSLKEKLALLQRQVERLYAKNEMMTTLNRIETKKMTEVEKATAEPSPQATAQTSPVGTPQPATSPVEPTQTAAKEPEAPTATPKQAESIPQPAADADNEIKGTNKELQEALEMEAVARVPKEQQQAEKEAATEGDASATAEKPAAS